MQGIGHRVDYGGQCCGPTYEIGGAMIVLGIIHEGGLGHLGCGWQGEGRGGSFRLGIRVLCMHGVLRAGFQMLQMYQDVYSHLQVRGCESRARGSIFQSCMMVGWLAAEAGKGLRGIA